MTTDPEDMYRALLNSRRLPRLRRLTYRCGTASRCLLLDAVETPLGILMHQRRFKQSEEVNQARSNASGRAKNTTDGVNHWKPRTYWIGSSALGHPADPDVLGSESGKLSVQCDHVGVPDVLLSAEEFREDWDTGRDTVLIRPDGSRMR